MKYISATYLRNITSYEISFYIRKNEYISVKKILNINNPFKILEDNTTITILDNGYYIVEIIPTNKNYICRIHLDNKKKVIEKFYIATKNNSLISGIPSYIDLKLSFVCTDKIHKIYNDDVIKEMYKNNEISLEDYNLAIHTIEKLKKEIIVGNNAIYNSSYEEYLN